jgi:hypothetical protein
MDPKQYFFQAQFKMKGIRVNTLLEIIYRRWGVVPLLVCLPGSIVSTMQNIIIGVSACSEAVSVLSGIYLYACSLTLPLTIMFFATRGTLSVGYACICA